jgi:pimeloyl-ACP methyl ester carboxylesterase
MLRSTPLPDVPVRVVIPRRRAGIPASSVEHIDTAHRVLAEQFPQGELVLADKTGHLIPIDRPDVVVEILRDVLSLNPMT